MAKKKSDAKLEAAMKSSLKAYADGNMDFFDFLQDDVRVFTVDSATPIIGRKAFESTFGPTFTKTKRTVDTTSHDLVLAGDRAILSQTLQITANGVLSTMRQTVIWEKGEDGRWLMAHIHNALLGQPIVVAGNIPRTAGAVRVLRERIATVSATLGVAQ